MEIETIKEEAKKNIAALCNKSIKVEYDMILNYPRVVESILNYHKIQDQQSIDEMNKLGKDSLDHYNIISNIVTKLGYQPELHITICERIPDILDCLNKQLEKEKTVRDIYKQIVEIAKRNRTKVKIGGFFGIFNQARCSLEAEVITADEVIDTFTRLSQQEAYHARMVEDLVGAMSMHINKQSI